MKITSKRVQLLLATALMIIPFEMLGQSRQALNPTPVPLALPLTFTWNDGPEGWMGTNDFTLTGKFDKLGGPVDGKAWVTICPRFPETYTAATKADTMGYENAYPGPNLLISPRFDLSKLEDTAIVISFQQSIAVEAGWDGGWMDFSTDDTTWYHLGVLNDAHGTNWYATALYTNAQMLSGVPPDTGTMKRPEYHLYGPGTTIPNLPGAWWTSNGPVIDDAGANAKRVGIPTGPFGWITCQLKVTKGSYPTIFQSQRVRFRYVAFSDAMVPTEFDESERLPYGGWAIDNFSIDRLAK
jgi:hypothetical protein